MICVNLNTLVEGDIMGVVGFKCMRGQEERVALYPFFSIYISMVKNNVANSARSHVST